MEILIYNEKEKQQIHIEITEKNNKEQKIYALYSAFEKNLEYLFEPIKLYLTTRTGKEIRRLDPNQIGYLTSINSRKDISKVEIKTTSNLRKLGRDYTHAKNPEKRSRKKSRHEKEMRLTNQNLRKSSTMKNIEDLL